MKRRGVNWGKLNHQQTKALVYSDRANNASVCRCCGKPVKYHSYCEEHWKQIGVNEMKQEAFRMIQEKDEEEERLRLRGVLI